MPMTWLQDFTALLCDADTVHRRWLKVRSEVPLGDQTALAEAWRLAGRDGKEEHLDASLCAARELMPDIRFAADVAKPMLQQTLAAIHGALHRLERPVVLPLDFNGKLSHVARNGFAFVLGEAIALPSDHALLTAVPEESRYLQDGRRYFVLGASVEPHDGGRYAADFYELAAVKKLTTEWSAKQRAVLHAHAAATAASVAASEARGLSR